MDQGDALLPNEFDVDWSLLDDDWGSGLLWSASELSGDAGQQQSARFNPWVDSATIPFPALPASYPPPDAHYPESIPFGEFAWTNDTVASSISAYQQDGAFFRSIEMPSSTSASNTSEIPLEIPEASVIAEQPPSILPAANFNPKRPEVKRRPAKPRLRCTHPRCTLTFPRPYELDRHVHNVHDRTVNVPCPVWGCSRISKPFGRIDKFREHFRKHKPSDNFLCLVEGCSMGPFTLPLLADHLLSQHQQDHPRSSDFYNIMSIISPDVLGGRLLFEIAEKRQEGKDVCPMASLGCSFRLSVVASDMADHINTHELLERARYYEDIVEYFKYGMALDDGLVTCLICKEWRSHKWYWPFLQYFVAHIKDSHSKEERQGHAKDLCEIFGPFSKEEVLYTSTCAWTTQENLRLFAEEFNEVGFSFHNNETTEEV